MDPVFQAALPSAPTSTRTFYSDETLTVLFEVYREQLTGAAAPVDLTTSVRDAAGRVVFRLQDQVGGDSLPGSGSGFGYTVPIPLKEVPPGAYLLRVEARSRRPADPVAVREVPFTVAALERHVP
jgi:hypothetical protein